MPENAKSPRLITPTPSQITLDATPELTAKHTIFGRISGPTIYNVLSLAEVELSPTEPDRPLYPPKLHTIKVLENPFDDIVPRITREEKMAQEAKRRKARAEAGKRREKVKK
jgi:peptidyl-prolyl cis-trans isomerase SDCCAG10